MSTVDTSQTKPLPDIAAYYLQPEKVTEYCNAMSDILCWLGGFKSGGGVYSPDSTESLRNLADALKSIQGEQATSRLSH